MNAEQYRSPKEQPLFVIALVISALFWLAFVVGTIGIGLIYVLMGIVAYLFAQAIFLARIKGNGVRIGAQQFPDLHQRIVEASRKLGLSEAPEAYLLNYRGAFNAFATRYLGRHFIVLFADLLENCDEQDGSIDFIVGHEVAHLALGHLKWNGVLLPSMLFPLLGPAYSRAKEYSCDRAGAAVAGDAKAAIAGLSVLAAGGRYAKRLSVEEYLRQGQDLGNFWLAVLELGMSHPYLPKRVGALLQQPAAGRNPFSYFFAPFLGAAGAGGAAASSMMAVAIIGILAAIAIPNFLRYQERSRETQARTSMMNEEQQESLRVLQRAAEQDAAAVEQAPDAPTADQNEVVDPFGEPEGAAAPAEEARLKSKRAVRPIRTNHKAR